MSDQMLIKAAASSLRITPVEKDKKPDRHKDGTVRIVNSDGTYLVALDEAPETPIACVPYCTAMVGDRVAVVLRSDGVYMAIGRLGGDLGGGDEGEAAEAMTTSQVTTIWQSIPFTNTIVRITDDQIDSIYEEE